MNASPPASPSGGKAARGGKTGSGPYSTPWGDTLPSLPNRKPTPVVKEAVHNTRFGTNDTVRSTSAMPPDQPASNEWYISTESEKPMASATAVSTALTSMTTARPVVAAAHRSRTARGRRTTAS